MAARIKNMKELNMAIEALEEQQKFEGVEIRATAEAFGESLKPANLVRQLIAEFVANRDIQKILKHTTSIFAGLAVQKATVSKKSNFFVRFLGRLMQMSITTVVDRMLMKK